MRDKSRLTLILIAISIAVILGVAKVSESMLGIMSIVGCAFIIYLGFSSLQNISNKDNIRKSYLII